MITSKHTMDPGPPSPPDQRDQKALLKTRALGNAILNSAKFSIIATDDRGIIQLFNVGAEHMLGYRADEVVNLIDPSEIQDHGELLARAESLSLEQGTRITPGFEALAFKASRGIADSYELTFICKDGSRFPAMVSITALHDDDQAIIGYLLIGADNSARRRVEAELTKAKAAAEKANLAKSDFLSNMSHELRSPLNAILGFAQLLESDPVSLTDNQKSNTGQILKAGWYLLDLINEILDLAVIESGKMPVSREPMSLEEVLLDCESMMQPQALAHGIGMSFCSFDQPCYISADRIRVKQVLINLLSNAIKYNREGGTVAVGCDRRSNGRVRISVSDTGCGLAGDKLAQLFQPFNRLGQETGAEEGTGIGLVMTKHLVELMGGSIGVESSLGEGSVFWVEWDAAVQPSLSRKDRAAAGDAPAMPGADPALRTILYVEDNPANLRLVEQLIERQPTMRLLGAGDAKQGIRLARQLLPDVILMDIDLPGISGIRALRILREDPLTQRIPVVAVSANAMPQDIRNSLDAGFFRYLTKPIKVAEFMEVLNIALDYAKAGAVRDRDPL